MNKDLQPKKISMYQLEQMSELEKKEYFTEENRKSKERWKDYDFTQLVFLTRKIRDKIEVHENDLTMLINLSECRYEYTTSDFTKIDDNKFLDSRVDRVDIGIENGLKKHFPEDKIRDISEIVDAVLRQDTYYSISRKPDMVDRFTNTKNYYLKLFETDEILNKYFNTPIKKAKYIEEAVSNCSGYWKKLELEKGVRQEKINTFLRKYRGIREEKPLRDKFAISKEKLDLLVTQIKPVVHKDGFLYYIKDVDPVGCSVIYDPQITTKVENLEKIASIRTHHRQEVPWMIRPSIAEVLAQIPKKYIEQTRAFEILVDTFNEYNNTFRTVLYKKN